MRNADEIRFELTSTLHRVGRHWRRLVRDVTDRHGISEACAHPLVSIGRLGDGIRQTTLADEVGIEGPSLVRLLDQLCACGFVERRDDPADRRAKTLWLTEAGRTATAAMEADLVALRADVLKDLSHAEIEGALAAFRAIEAAALAREADA